MSRSSPASHLLTAAWAILLALLLLLPAEAYDPTGQGWLDRMLERLPLIDKLVHVALFAVMALLARRSFVLAGVARPILWTTVLTMAYGALLEVLQAPVPGRSTSVLDMIANTVGVLCATIMMTSPGRQPNEGERVPPANRGVADDPAVEESDS